jgi:hypothetical protein
MIENYGAACWAFCHEVNMPMTASTEACCAATDPFVTPALLKVVATMGAALVADSDAATNLVCCARTCARGDAGWSTGFPAGADSLRYVTARGSRTPSQRRSTYGRCGATEEAKESACAAASP